MDLLSTFWQKSRREDSAKAYRICLDVLYDRRRCGEAVDYWIPK